jgi:hypothetical protein
MNTNDLPPAARLAALIDAGRAAHPEIRHGNDGGLTPDCDSGCALAFACLGMGLSKQTLFSSAFRTGAAVNFLRIDDDLADGVVYMNDAARASLDDICKSLREGELAKIPA